MSVLSPDKITGTQGGWEMESSGLSITTGHLASITWVNQREIIAADGFLRRQKFEGHPEYNRMETDLHMQEHSIEYENGEFKGKLSSNQLLFNHAGQSIEVSLGQGPKIQLKAGPRKVELNSNQLSLGGFQMGPGGWMMPSKVDVNWNQVPFYELTENKNTEEVWKFVDERCEKRHALDFPQGRLFLVGRFKNRENAGLFICSTPSTENDGYGKEDIYSYYQKKLKARAYLIAKVGREYDDRTFNVSDDPNNLISLSLPEKVTKDTWTRIAILLAWYMDHRDFPDSTIKEYNYRLSGGRMDWDKFTEEYKSRRLPEFFEKFFKRVELLYFEVLKDKKMTIDMVKNINETLIRDYGIKDPKYFIVLNFKKFAPDKPW